MGNANHAFALWSVVRTLKPKHIIESGVWCGQTSWLLRQAAGPGTWIYPLDPRPMSMFAYRDNASSRSRYFTGQAFKDLSEVDWGSLIPAEDKSRVLVVLDDHQSCTRRVKELLAHGF